MPQISSDFVRRLRAPLYILVAYLSLGSVMEILVGGWPLRLHDVNWRLGALNSAAGATGTELLALVLLIVVGQLAWSRGALWTGFWYSLLIGVANVGAAAIFALDSLQVRARIPATQVNQFDATVAWGLARFGIAGLVCFWLAACALAAARLLGREAARDASNPRAGLIVGAGPSAASPLARAEP